jgi:hypothetical protein
MKETPRRDQVDPTLKRVLVILAVLEFLGFSAAVTYWFLR